MTDTVAYFEDIRSLVNRALLGDQQALVQIIERYRGRVYGLCFHILRRREDAEDVSQEALLRMSRNLGSWDQERAFEPWLFTIATNRCRSRLAQLHQQPDLSPLANLPTDGRWQDEFAARVLQEEIILALESVPKNHGIAFQLFHEQELSYQEIAQRLSVPEGTVKTWVHRARRALAHRLIEREVFHPSEAKAS